jgi:hypothetical protein
MTDQTTPPTDETAPRGPFESFLYHQRRALEETGKALEALLPEGFREHGMQATKEFTKGMRVLMEAAVEEVKKATDKVREQQAAKSAAGDSNEPPMPTGKVKVEVD